MNLNDFTQFATQNPVCFMATQDRDQPRVRTLIMFFADETGFYFITLSPKDMSKQLHKNPKVEVCFYNNSKELAQAKMMRLTGKVKFLDDKKLKKRAHEERIFLDDMAGESLEPYIEIIRINSGDLHFWTMADVMKEHQIEHIKF